MIPVPLHSLTAEQATREILMRIMRIEAVLVPTEQIAEIERQIRANTEALASMSSHPPVVGAPMLRRWLLNEGDPMSETPFASVTQALADQAAAMSALTAELAAEHQQWLDAVAAGDTAQAEAVVAEVQANTDKLNTMVADLQASVPGGAVTPPVEPVEPVEPPVEPPVVEEPPVVVEPPVEPPVDPTVPLEGRRNKR